MIEAITGSNGFLGSTLGQRLGHFKALDRSGNIPRNINIVYDCATYGNMANHKGDDQIYEANLMRVIREVDQLQNKLIYISSSSVTRPVHTPYSLSKKATEEYLSLQDKQIAIVRPYSITGMGEQESHLIPTLIRSCLYGEQMPFVDWPTHDFVDVRDAVDALIIIRDKGQFRREVYEVGMGINYTNDEVRQRVEYYTGKKANLRHISNMRNYDDENWKSNPRAIRNLGWRPNFTLSSTIEEMVKHEKRNT